jgi:hypothetical protein
VLAQSLTQGFPARLPDAIKTTALGTRHSFTSERGGEGYFALASRDPQQLSGHVESPPGVATSLAQVLGMEGWTGKYENTLLLRP